MINLYKCIASTVVSTYRVVTFKIGCCELLIISHSTFVTCKDLLVILNDNNMSISPNVGGLSNYLAKVLSSPLKFSKVLKVLIIGQFTKYLYFDARRNSIMYRSFTLTP